jgi:hypothetical protein
MTTTDFDGFQRALVRDVGGFSGPKAQMWIGFTGRYKDEELQKLRDWRGERYPATCGADALQLVASTFDLAVLSEEIQVDWRSRLTTAWDIHTLSGSWPSIDTMMLASGCTAVSYIERWETAPDDENYTRTRINCDFPGFTATTLGGGLTLPFMLGHNLPIERLREWIAIIERFRSAHCLPPPSLCHSGSARRWSTDP